MYDVYLKYVAPEDIHVYSVDEVFMDVTPYLMAAKMTAREFAVTIIRDVLATTGITATAGGVAAAILFGYLNAVLFTPKTKK